MYNNISKNIYIWPINIILAFKEALNLEISLKKIFFSFEKNVAAIHMWKLFNKHCICYMYLVFELMCTKKYVCVKIHIQVIKYLVSVDRGWWLEKLRVLKK